MMSTGINLVMTVIGFTVSTMFIVFVCTRLIWARILVSASRRSLSVSPRSDLTLVSSPPSCPDLSLLDYHCFPELLYGFVCLEEVIVKACSRIFDDRMSSRYLEITTGQTIQ